MIPELAGLKGEAAHAARTIEVTISKIENIAKGQVSGAESLATDSRGALHGADIGTAPFSDVPLAQELAKQHQAAHDVFVDTVRGVVQDLRDFQENLIASARAHEGTDDAAYQTLVALGKDYRGHEYHSKTNWDHSREEQGDNLHDDDRGSSDHHGHSGHGSHQGSHGGKTDSGRGYGPAK